MAAEEVVKLKFKDLIPYRHALQLSHDGITTYWSSVAVIRWCDDLKRVRVMFDNHAFLTRDEDYIATVKVQSDDCTGYYKGLPDKREVAQELLVKAEAKHEQLRAQLNESYTALRRLRRVVKKVVMNA